MTLIRRASSRACSGWRASRTAEPSTRAGRRDSAPPCATVWSVSGAFPHELQVGNPESRLTRRRTAGLGGLRVLAFWDDQHLIYLLPERGTVTVGRGEGVELQITDRAISRQHVRIHVTDRLCVEDLGSANGTFVRGRSLKPGETVEVQPGDMIGLGRTMLFIQRAPSPVRPVQLYTHDYFEARLDDECGRSERGGRPFSVVRIHHPRSPGTRVRRSRRVRPAGGCAGPLRAGRAPSCSGWTVRRRPPRSAREPSSHRGARRSRRSRSAWPAARATGAAQPSCSSGPTPRSGARARSSDPLRRWSSTGPWRISDASSSASREARSACCSPERRVSARASWRPSCTKNPPGRRVPSSRSTAQR